MSVYHSSSTDTLPLQSECSHGHSSAPALSLHDLDDFDDTPFSESFSGWLEADSSEIAWADKSYTIEQITDIREYVPEWEDDDIDEIVIMSPKPKPPPAVRSNSLPTIYEDVDDVAYGLKKTAAMADFEILENRAGNTLCRRRDGGHVLAMRRVKHPQELSIMHAVNNLCAPFLATMQCDFMHADVLHVVSDFGQRGSLQSIVTGGNPLGSQHALSYASEIVEALETIHLAGMVHRGVCPENVQIDSDGHILLTGFDDAAFLDERNGESNARSYHGIMRSPRGHQCEYRPPEVLLGWETSEASDSWGFGLLLYLMLSGRHAFGLEDNVNLHNVLYGGVSLDFSIPLSHAARDLISRCVVKNPRLRMSFAQIKQHDYFRHVDWRKVQDKQLRVPHLPSCVYTYVATDTSPPSCPPSRPLHLAPPLLERPSLRPCGSLGSAISNLSLDNGERHLHPLPPILCESAALNIPDEVLEVTIDAGPLLGESGSVPCETLNKQTRMELFWQSLDEELSDDVECSPPHRLRKQRSFPVLNSPRLSLLVPKFRKKLGHSSSTLSLRTPETAAKLDLPKGIEQIGHGIGFTYSMPAAVISRASICSSAPKNCHPGMQNFGLGAKRIGGKVSRKAVAETDVYARRSRSSDLPSMEDQLFAQGDQQIFSPALTSSPLTDAGPLTPPQDIFELSVPAPEMTKDASPTLRLVPQSPVILSLGAHPFYDLLDNVSYV